MKRRKSDFFNPEKLYVYDQKRNMYILNIAVNSFKELYNTWDYSPHKKRDINDALIKYIEDCSAEMPLKGSLALHFYLPENQRHSNPNDEGSMALKGYFQYLLHKKLQEKNRYMKNARLYGITGFLLLTLAFLIQKTGIGNTYLPILPEGLYIGGWVLFWEVFSIIFFRSRELSQKIREYRRMYNADIYYHFADAITKKKS